MLSPNAIQEVETTLIKLAQHKCFHKEIDRISRKESAHRNSSLVKLNPAMNETGLLFVKGRLTNCEQTIIPKCHACASVIVRDAQQIANTGVEWTLCIVRKKYWIVGAHVLIKCLVKSCVTCRKLYPKGQTQIMSEMPYERVEHGKPPFTYVGVDVFGPLYMKHNRSEVKRYGFVLTCMVLRALHIKKLNSLGAESLLNALWHFVSRRGVH